MIVSVFVSCSSATDKMSFDDIYQKLTDECSDFTDTLFLDDTSDAVLTYGIKDDLIRNAAFLKAPDSNIRSDELILIEAVSQTAIEDLKTVFAKIQQEKYLKWENMDADEFEKVKNYKTVSHDKYMIYIVGDNADEILNCFNNLFSH